MAPTGEHTRFGSGSESDDDPPSRRPAVVGISQNRLAGRSKDILGWGGSGVMPRRRERLRGNASPTAGVLSDVAELPQVDVWRRNPSLPLGDSPRGLHESMQGIPFDVEDTQRSRGTAGASCACLRNRWWVGVSTIFAPPFGGLLAAQHCEHTHATTPGLLRTQRRAPAPQTWWVATNPTARVGAGVGRVWERRERAWLAAIATWVRG